jgi:hypothetical protein
MKKSPLFAAGGYVDGKDYLRLSNPDGTFCWYVFDDSGWLVVTDMLFNELEEEFNS